MVKRLQFMNGKWSDIFNMYLQKMCLNNEYIWKTSFRSLKNFPILKILPTFYQEIILAFNNAKRIKQFQNLSTSEIMTLPIWGSEYFKVNNTCIYFKSWIKKGVYYIKDLINENGTLKNDNELYNCTDDKRDIIKEIYILRKYVMKRIKHYDVTIAPYTKVRIVDTVLYQNRFYSVRDSKSKLYYNMLVNQTKARGNMETIYAREFTFENRTGIWNNIYNQKLLQIKIPKIREFNFKLFHNIIACGKTLSKWRNINEKCEFCGKIETTKHMVYECTRVKLFWEELSDVVKCDITWKTIVCGFPKYSNGTNVCVLNYIISIMAYSIYKVNNRCKFDEISYKCVNLKRSYISTMFYYVFVIDKLDPKLKRNKFLREICDKIH